jgi:hypothetical protein
MKPPPSGVAGNPSKNTGWKHCREPNIQPTRATPRWRVLRNPPTDSRRSPWRSVEIYELFFFLSAQRFFIASDNLFLPAGVRPRLRFLEGAVLMGMAILLVVLVDSFSSKAMARLIRSLSLFNSETILARSNFDLL